MHMTNGKRSLEGLTVLDFTHAAAGPLCTMLLSDFGATVIKVEKPGRGDSARFMTMAPHMSDHIQGGDYYLSLNRNKKSLALDLSKPEGRALAAELAEEADIIIENFRPGVMDRLGLSYDIVKETNPGVVYCSITGFGTTGRLAGEPGMDLVAQARAGTFAITGYPGGPPTKPGVSIADLSAGLQATIGILLALRVREATGAGQRVEVSLLDATLLMLSNYGAAILNNDIEIKPMGAGHPQLAPYQAFKCKDGYMFIACGTNRLWRKLCEALDRPDLQEDPRFVSNGKRSQNREALAATMEETLANRTAAEWLDHLAKAGIPVAPVAKPRDAYLEQYAEGSPIVQTVQHPLYGELLLPGVSIRLSKTPGEAQTYPPRLGENTLDVLEEFLGMSPERIQQLEAIGAVHQYRGEVDTKYVNR